jgi:hypothetical protein
VGAYLLGYTVLFQAGQVLQHEVNWPSPPAEFASSALWSPMSFLSCARPSRCRGAELTDGSK